MVLEAIKMKEEKDLFFNNKDEAWYWPYEVAKGVHLAPTEIMNYAIDVFVDDSLPKETAWEVINTIGLKNYTIKFGICDERSDNR